MVRVRRQNATNYIPHSSWIILCIAIVLLVVWFCYDISLVLFSGDFNDNKNAVYYLGRSQSIWGGTSHQDTTEEEEKQAKCIDAIKGSESKSRIAVAVMAANRPEYFEKLIRSLENQTVRNHFDVFFFVDKVPGGKSSDNEKVIELAKEYELLHGGGGVHIPKENFGIARMTLWAVETMFAAQLKQHKHKGEEVYDRILVLEEDHLIGHNYIEAMGMLLTAAEQMDEIAVVNGNMIDTPRHGTKLQKSERESMLMIRNDDECLFQVAPLDSITHINSHNVWAWATTWNKWEKIHDSLLQVMHQSKLNKVNYKKRNRKLIGKLMDRICPGSGYSNWKGQDWLRACVFYSMNMKYKLQPTNRLMSYIGESGLHMKKEVFKNAGFNPVEAYELNANIENYPRDLCTKTCILERMG